MPSRLRADDRSSPSCPPAHPATSTYIPVGITRSARTLRANPHRSRKTAVPPRGSRKEDRENTGRIAAACSSARSPSNTPPPRASSPTPKTVLAIKDKDAIENPPARAETAQRTVAAAEAPPKKPSTVRIRPSASATLPVRNPFETFVETGLDLKSSPFPTDHGHRPANGRTALPPPEQHNSAATRNWLGTSRARRTSGSSPTPLEMLGQLKSEVGTAVSNQPFHRCSRATRKSRMRGGLKCDHLRELRRPPSA